MFFVLFLGEVVAQPYFDEELDQITNTDESEDEILMISKQ